MSRSFQIFLPERPDIGPRWPIWVGSERKTHSLTVVSQDALNSHWAHTIPPTVDRGDPARAVGTPSWDSWNGEEGSGRALGPV